MESFGDIPDRWEVGPYFAHHLASSTPLHPYVTLNFEMLLFHFLPIWTLKPHKWEREWWKRSGVKLHFVRSVVEVDRKPRFSAKMCKRSADEAEKKGIPSVALQVPFLTTWDVMVLYNPLKTQNSLNHIWVSVIMTCRSIS